MGFALPSLATAVVAATTAVATPAATYAALPATAMAPAACPKAADDFFDKQAWLLRRVEPQDCATLTLRTPVFSWPQARDRRAGSAWRLNVANSAGTVVATHVAIANRVLLPLALPAGASYTWTVSYQDTQGAQQTSAPRRFAVAPQAIALPTGEAFAATVAAKARPRALAPGSSGRAIATAAASSELAPSYNEFMARAGRLRDSAPAEVPTEDAPTTNTRSMAYTQWTSTLRKQAMAERAAVETLAHAALLSGDATFASAALRRALLLAAWPTRGATSELVQDQANREVYLALALALDLLASHMSNDQGTTIANALKDRLAQAMAEIGKLDDYPFNSHVFTATQYVTEALVHAAGAKSFPEAQGLLAQAWEAWITTVGAWGGSDGGYGNSTAYGWYTMAALPRAVALVRLAAGVDMTGWAAVGRLGHTQMAFTPPAARLRGQFGDQTEIDAHYFHYAADSFRLYAALTGNAEHEWYWRQHAANINSKASQTPYHFLLLGLGRNRPSPKAPTAASWVFEDAGLVALHSAVADPRRSSLFFRSSRLGSFNHSHADNNAFTYVSKGVDLLLSGGYYPFYMSPHHAQVGRATRYKNALTFDGGIGQAEPAANPSAPGAPIHSMETRGQLVNFGENGAWVAATGDATLAYRGQSPGTTTFTPLLTNALRTVLLNRSEKVTVVYDWATSDTARRWELNFQSASPAQLTGTTARVAQAGASVCIDVHGPAMTVQQTTGFPIAPESALPDQAQTRYRATDASRQLVAVTVLREDCRNVPVSVVFDGTKASVAVAGAAPVVLDKRSTQLPQ